jgi:hypothetical protein
MELAGGQNTQPDYKFVLRTKNKEVTTNIEKHKKTPASRGIILFDCKTGF